MGAYSLRAGAARAAVAIAIVLVSLLVFWPTTSSLIERWTDNVHRTYTHGYAVLALTLWLLWRGRDRWEYCKLTPVPAAAVLLVAQGVLWLVVYRAGLQIAHQTLLPVMMLTALFTCFGMRLTRAMSLPVLFLYFAIPLWNLVNPLLQWISVFAVRLLLRIADIPAHFVGNSIHIPAGTFEIAGGCSGLHFFIVACVIAVLQGEVNRDNLRIRCRMVVLAGLLAMFTNWIRVLILVVVGHVTDMQHYLVAEEHYSFGWFMFAGTMTVYFLITRRWPADGAEEDPRSNEADASAISRPAVALALLTLCAVPAWSYLFTPVPGAAALPDPFPADSRAWSRSEVSAPEWTPVFVGADREVSAVFDNEAMRVEGYSALYAQQRQGKELVGHENSAFGPTLMPRRVSETAIAPWKASRAIDRRGDTWLVLHAYRVDDDWHSRALTLQLSYAVRSLFAAPLAAIVVLRARCDGEDCTEAQAGLQGFAANSWPQGGGAR